MTECPFAGIYEQWKQRKKDILVEKGNWTNEINLLTSAPNDKA